MSHDPQFWFSAACAAASLVFLWNEFVKWHERRIAGQFATIGDVIRWILRQDAVSVLYVVITALLMLWLVWTFQ